MIFIPSGVTGTLLMLHLYTVTQGNTEIPKLTGKNKIMTITAKAQTTWKGGEVEGKLPSRT